MFSWLFRRCSLSFRDVPSQFITANSQRSRYLSRSSSNAQINDTKKVCRIGEDIIEFETGHIARFADGAVTVSYANNSLLATVVSKEEANNNRSDHFPLTVDFKQSASALGRIPTNYFRRELQMTDDDILASRAIDRSIRPLFPCGFIANTQVICKPLALDDDGDAVILGLNAASAALSVSNIPWNGPIGAVRIGLFGNQIEINPKRKYMKNSSLNLILVGCGDGDRIIMLEMDGKQINSETLLKCIDRGLIAVSRLIAVIDELRDAAGKTKREVIDDDSNELMEEIRMASEDRLYYILSDSKHDKVSRDLAVKELAEDVVQLLDEEDERDVRYLFSQLLKTTLRNFVIETDIRSDGRRTADFRPINIHVDVHKKLHGSALFQRGQTQVLSTVTFDSSAAAFHPDAISQLLGSQQRKMFMLHYDFPSYATNEIASSAKRISRRELGHGNLAEKALVNVMPEEFPYCTRLSCEVLESNGSSSMASVCAGTLALMDAGVHLLAPVAGLAIGLFFDNEQSNYKILTDLMGLEDYAGHMDFKIAGTINGFTAIQLDLKVDGIDRGVFVDALTRGKDGILKLLDIMHAVQPESRATFKSSVPVFEIVPIQIYKRQILFRGGAFNQKLIEAETGVKILIEDDSNIKLMAPNREKLDEAKKQMEKIFMDETSIELTFGGLYKAEVVKVLETGVMLQLTIGIKPMFLKNSNLDARRVVHASALGVQVGSIITVQYLGRDSVTGQHRVSRRTIQTTSLPVQNLCNK